MMGQKVLQIQITSYPRRSITFHPEADFPHIPRDVSAAIIQNARIAYQMYAPARIQRIVSEAINYARNRIGEFAGDVQSLAIRALGYAAATLGLPAPTTALRLPGPVAPAPARTPRQIRQHRQQIQQRKRARKAQRQARRIARQARRFEDDYLY